PRQNWHFVEVETDAGLVGIGEASLEWRERAVAAAVDELAALLIGQDPNLIEHHWQRMHRHGFWRGGVILTSAISGIDQALWDIKGKRLGVPVYDLLGGAVRDHMRVSAWIGGDRPDELAESARERISAGYTALKMNATGEMEWIDTRLKIQAAVDRLGVV